MDLEPNINDYLSADTASLIAEATPSAYPSTKERARTSPSGPLGGEADKAGALRCWATTGEFFYGSTTTQPTIPAGVYRIGDHGSLGIVFVPMDVKTDDLLELPDDAGRALLDEFKVFWTKGDAFHRFGMVHKRGLLLWGPPGSGKTSTLQLMIAAIIKEQEGLVVYCDYPALAKQGLALLRRIEPTRPIVVILEDIDSMVARGMEQDLLALLDGESQIDRVLFVATTNYPERLDKRIINRPSRFDTIKYVGMPTKEGRTVYLTARMPDASTELISDWVGRTDGFSIAHLREIIIAVHCFGQPIGDVIKRLESMRHTPKSTDDNPVGGFLTGITHSGLTNHR